MKLLSWSRLMLRSRVHVDAPILDATVELYRTGRFHSAARIKLSMRMVILSAQTSRCNDDHVLASRTPCGCG